MGTPVSGPGQFSERTDKAVENANLSTPNADYGEAKAMKEQRQAAPMASSPGFSAIFGNMGPNVTGLDAPSTQPGVPVTNGAALGAGAGEGALGLPDQQSQDIESLIPYLPVLEFMANQPGASWAMRNIVRKAKSLR